MKRSTITDARLVAVPEMIIALTAPGGLKPGPAGTPMTDVTVMVQAITEPTYKRDRYRVVAWEQGM